MKTLQYLKIDIFCCLFIFALANANGQTYDFSVDFTDTSTYNVTCGKVIPSQWGVKNDSCEMTSPYFRVAEEDGALVNYSFRINQSGNGDTTDKCYVYHAVDNGSWVLDTLIIAADVAAVFPYSASIFLNYTHYIQFKIVMQTNANTEFWAIKSGNFDVTDGDTASLIEVYSGLPPAPLPTPPLPVELMSFTGQAMGNAVKLNWVTASETNNDYFTIERSDNVNIFEIAGYVDGAGNSNTMKAYEFYDNYPYDITYYWLKQTDFDGTSTHSNIIMVQMPKENATNIQITSSGNDLLLMNKSKENGLLTIKIFSLSGRLLFSTSIKINENQNTYSIKPNLPLGALYVVIIGFEDKYPIVDKLFLN